jgi:hypothetical protein
MPVRSLCLAIMTSACCGHRTFFVVGLKALCLEGGVSSTVAMAKVAAASSGCFRWRSPACAGWAICVLCVYWVCV